MPARTRRMGRPFDFAACTDSSLEHLIVDHVFNRGGSGAATLIALSLVTTTFNKIVSELVARFVSKTNQRFADLRQITQEHQNAKYDLRQIIGGDTSEAAKACEVLRIQREDLTETIKREISDRLGQDYGSAISSWMYGICDDGVWHEHFEFSSTIFAAAATRTCMLCRNPKCQITARNGCMTHGGVALHARRRCLEAMALQVECLSSFNPIERWLKQPTVPSDANAERVMQACAMLRLRGKTNAQSGRNALVMRVRGLYVHRLLVDIHPYLPDDFTLQGRLGMTEREMAIVHADVQRTQRANEAEIYAMQRIRWKKHYSELNIMLSRQLGEVGALGQLFKSFNELEPTLKHILHWQDPASAAQRAKGRRAEIQNLGAHVLDIAAIAEVVEKILFFVGKIWRLDRSFGGKFASGDAYQWAIGLHGQFFNSSAKDLRPCSREKRSWPKWQTGLMHPTKTLYDIHPIILLALRLYDDIEADSLTIVRPSWADHFASGETKLMWKIRTQIGVLCGTFVPTTVCTKTLHATLEAAMGAYAVLIKLPALPPRRDEDGLRTVLYHSQMAKILLSHAKIKHLITIFFDISVEKIVQAVRMQFKGVTSIIGRRQDSRSWVKSVLSLN